MKPISAISRVVLCCASILVGQGALAQARPARDPIYAGKSLSSWIDEIHYQHLRALMNTNRPGVCALRAIGTNAIPWLLCEITNQSPPDAATELRYLHQTRAKTGFWALGEIAAPAVPKLLELVEKEPQCVPSALAGIGSPGLSALERCITNAPHFVPPYLLNEIPSEQAAVSALGALYVSIDIGRTAKADATRLLPAIRPWAKDTNREANYWARGVLRQLGEEE
jgi:hypothetical protein